MPLPRFRLPSAVRALHPKRWLPKTRGVEDADGGFLESFTALSWKQENRRRLQSAREEDNATSPPPTPTVPTSGTDFSLTAEQKEVLYAHVLYTIEHRVPDGDAPDDERRQLVDVARQVLAVSDDVHDRCLHDARTESAPSLFLKVTVVEAKGLEAKDPNGFSDPYCMLGIQPGGSAPLATATIDVPEADEEDTKAVKRGHGFRLSFKRRERSESRGREREAETTSAAAAAAAATATPPGAALPNAIPAKLVCATSVRPATLDPDWNETFRFDVDDLATDKLHLDIWDHDDESSVLEAVKKLNEIQTWKGLGRYFKQIAQSARTSGGDNVDDFLGSVTIALNSIPASGMDRWFELRGRSQRSTVQGQLRLRLEWAGRFPPPPFDVSARRPRPFAAHEQLLRALVRHETSQRVEGEIDEWDGHFTGHAPSLLLQHHAVLAELSPVQRAMAEWIALSREHSTLGVPHDVLLAALERLDEAWTGDTLADDEEEPLAEAFGLFVDLSLSLLRRQRDLFPATHAQSLVRLHALLRCLARVRAMAAFRRCCPFRKDVQAEVSAIVKKATLEWYEKMNALTRPQVNDDDSTLQSFVELINIVNDDTHRAAKFYEPLFVSTLELSYFVLTYKQLDRLVTDDVGVAVQELCETFRQLDVVEKDMNDQHLTMGTGLFELYLALQEFVQFQASLPDGEPCVLATADYAQWFGDAVTRWLHIARYKAMLRIRKAIEIEKTVTQMDSMVKHSTSAVDTCACFYQIKTFWKQLAWPDRVSSYGYIAKILDDICYGAVYFADLTYRKLCDAGFYDEDGQFDVTEQLCVTINNIEHVRESLERLPSELGVESVLGAVEMAKGEVASGSCRKAIDQVMRSALDDIQHQILRVVEHVGEKMRADVRKFAFHLSWAPDGLPADEAIVPLMEYLDANLTTLNAYLLPVNFECVLAALWAVVQEELRIQAESGVGEKRSIFYQRLNDGLHYLKDYFHAEGKGMSKERLENGQYQSFQRFLDLHRNDTETLIVNYYLERLETQKHIIENGPRDYGVLSVRVYFHHDSLSVEILSARDILALDTNGYSDPFVIIEILPQSVFTQCPTQRTRVQKKTLTPIFEEIFEYPATLEQCNALGAMIQFTVMDHDMVLSNDFAGEAFLPLDHIPGITDDSPSNLHGLKPIDLPLLRPKRNENEILNALEKRPWDRRAQDFVKGQKAHSA